MRLALARPPEHALSRAVKEAGWEPVHFPFTQIVALGTPPPQALNDYSAVVLPSPNAAWALRPWLEVRNAPVLVAQGQGTLEALASLEVPGARLRRAAAPTAEGIWELLRAEFPDGGSFLLARGERSRGYLEEVAQGTPWRISPWVTHREQPAEPIPPAPAVEAVLALSPLQAEVLGGLAAGLLRFGWGERTAFGFRKAGTEATATCEPRIEALKAMLREHLNSKAPL